MQSRKTKKFYKGYTSDLKRRFLEHNQKRGGAYSRQHAPFDLIFYEAYLDKKDAVNAEQFYKSGYGREVLKDKLKNYLKKSVDKDGRNG